MANGGECKVISVGMDEQIKEKEVCDGDVLKKIHDELAPKITRVHSTRGKSGTGFFVGDGDKVITNAHVATSESLTITTSEGKTFPAFVEKYDDKHDLALLSIVGIDKNAKRAVKLSGTETISGTVYSVGHPMLGDLTVSPGRSLGNGTQYKAMEKRLGAEETKAMLERAEKRIGEKQAADLKAQLNSEEIWLKQFDTPGSSGSPQLDQDGNLVAVLHSGYDHPDGRVTGNIPLKAVKDLLSSDPGRFKFNYEWERYNIQSESGKQLAVALELKSIKRLNVPLEDQKRPPFFFDLLPPQ